jgi:hypothetical protein
MMDHHFSAGRDLLHSIKRSAGAILPGSPSLKEQQKSARLPPPDVPSPQGQIFPSSPSSYRKRDTGEAYICSILHMEMTLKLKLNMSREYLGLFIYPQKPSAGLPNLMR